MTKATYLLIVIILLVKVEAIAQHRELMYAAENSDLRNFYLASDGYKIVAETQKGANPMHIYLLSKENLFVDTLNNAIYFNNIHPSLKGKIIVEGSGFAEVWRIEDNKILFESRVAKCGKNERSNVVVFNKWLLEFKRHRAKKESFESLSYLKLNGDCFTDKDLINVVSTSTDNYLNKKFIYSLPATFGVGNKNLGLFMRDSQKFFLLDSLGKYQLFKLPINKDFVWSYFFDWQTENHYFVKALKDNFELYVKKGSELIYVQLLNGYPEKIVKNGFIYCDGSFKENCDYYYEQIKPDEVGKSANLTLLKSEKIE